MTRRSGQVGERLKPPVSKTGMPARVSRVRIPPCPSDAEAAEGRRTSPEDQEGARCNRQVIARARRCCTTNASKTAGSKYPNALATSRAYSNSASDANEMLKKRLNSFTPLRDAPSTMFTAPENAARRVFEVSPYSSCLGHFSVARYTSR